MAHLALSRHHRLMPGIKIPGIMMQCCQQIQPHRRKNPPDGSGSGMVSSFAQRQFTFLSRLHELFASRQLSKTGDFLTSLQKLFESI